MNVDVAPVSEKKRHVSRAENNRAVISESRPDVGDAVVRRKSLFEKLVFVDVLVLVVEKKPEKVGIAFDVVC
jgi:hypothetical protein